MAALCSGYESTRIWGTGNHKARDGTGVLVVCAVREMRDLATFYLYKSGMPAIDTCPMAELVTASDCYPTWDCSSEGREFEPHWGSSFFVNFFSSMRV